MKNELANKKTLSIFNPSKNSPLSYAQLLVFCHRADQFRYDTVPSCRRVAKATGLHEATVSTADQSLRAHGLLSPDNTVINPCRHLHWFQPLDRLKERNPDGPNLQWLQNWKTLVRQPGDNVLTLSCVLVYSLIRHSQENGWKPSQGWTHEYLAILTATEPKTVTKAVSTLEEHGFLKVLDGMRFQLFRLRDSQTACFADKKQWSGNSSEPDEFINDFGPGSDRLDIVRTAKADLDELLGGWAVSDKDKASIKSAIYKHDGWEDNWEDLANKYLDKYLD